MQLRKVMVIGFLGVGNTFHSSSRTPDAKITL